MLDFSTFKSFDTSGNGQIEFLEVIVWFVLLSEYENLLFCLFQGCELGGERRPQE